MDTTLKDFSSGGTDDGGLVSRPIAPEVPPAAGLSHMAPHPDALSEWAARGIISHAAAARLCLLYYLTLSHRRHRPCIVSVARIAARLSIPITTAQDALADWQDVKRLGRNGERCRQWVFAPSSNGKPVSIATENPFPHKRQQLKTTRTRKKEHDAAQFHEAYNGLLEVRNATCDTGNTGTT